MTIKIRQYKIKKIYNLKEHGTGFFIYSRHILGRYIGDVSSIKGKTRHLKRYRISKSFATRRGAIRAAKNLKQKSDAIIMPMVKKDESSK